MAFFTGHETRRLPYCGCYVIVDHEKKYLPLVHLDARTSIISSTSRTTLTQTFVNPDNNTPLKHARYIFPLYDGVSVVGFTCTVGSRVIKGVVKERQEAKKAFDEAVSKGETAGLLEQSHEASDVFTTTLGNVPTGQKVRVEITYLGELKHDTEINGLRFTIPTSIAPRYGDSSLTTGDIARPGTAISVTVDTDMSDGSVIKSIQSPSHPISVNIGNTSAAASASPSLQRASATLSLGSAELGKDFIIQIVATGLGDPAAVLETHPTIPNQRALMTTLVPRFNLPVETPEVVFVCDRSGSMGQGQKIPNLIAALQIFLKSLPIGVKFNICSFGSQCSFLWSKSQTYDQDTLDKAVDHVKRFWADFGGTEMYQPMKETFERRYKDMNLEIFLLTDGEIWNQSELIQLINEEVAKSKGAIRIFTLGIGEDVSHALVEGVARAGNGFAQTVAENEKMDKKLIRMLKGALTPHITDYTLEINYSNNDVTTVDDEDDDFELVEKVIDALTINVEDELGKGSQRAAEQEKKAERKTISLFDPNASDEDLEMPDASNIPEVKLPSVTAPRYLQSPFSIPPLFPFNRTTVYILLSDSTPFRKPKSVVLRGTSSHGPLQLEIPITTLTEKGTTIHQLAARKAIGELEEGRGWLFRAKNNQGKLLKDEFEGRFSDMVKREAVRLGVRFQVGGKWCSFVAIQENDNEKRDCHEVGEFEVIPAGDTSTGYDFMNLRGGGNVKSTGVVRHRMGANLYAQMGSAPRMVMMAKMAPPLPQPLAMAAPSSDLFSSSYDDDAPANVSGSSSRSTHFAKRSVAHQQKPEQMEILGVDPSQPLSALATLQRFGGSWQWNEDLESVIGITEQHALSKVSLPAKYDKHKDILATVCAVVYLKKRLAFEKDTWELFVEKAEKWLASHIGESVESLEKIVEDGLFS